MPRKGYKQSPEHIEKKNKALRERYHAIYGAPKTPEERRAANAEYMRRKRAADRNPQGEDLRAKRDAIIAAARPILERVERAKREAKTTTDAPYGYVRKERKL